MAEDTTRGQGGPKENHTQREMEPRSDVWPYFDRFKDDQDGKKKARCKRCRRVLLAIHGTRSLWKHKDKCWGQEPAPAAAAAALPQQQASSASGATVASALGVAAASVSGAAAALCEGARRAASASAASGAAAPSTSIAGAAGARPPPPLPATAPRRPPTTRPCPASRSAAESSCLSPSPSTSPESTVLEMQQLDLSEAPWDEAESFVLTKYPSYEIDWDSLLAAN